MAAKPLSKTKVVGHIAEKVGTPKKTAVLFFEELFKLAVKEAKGGAGKFVIPGIGRVVKAHRKARMGRNPQTGEAIKIKAKTVVRLRPSKAFKDAVLKRSEEHTSELQSRRDLVCRLLLEKKKNSHKQDQK